MVHDTLGATVELETKAVDNETICGEIQAKLRALPYWMRSPCKQRAPWALPLKLTPSKMRPFLGYGPVQV